MTFYDTHAHLDYPDFSNDLPEVIDRARAAGIQKIICIGTDLESSERAVELAHRFAGLHAVVGWHPSYAAKAPDDLRPGLRRLATDPKVAALGETGLDYSRLPSAANGTAGDDQACKEKQAAVFQQQLEVAAELGLNCVIHQREALEDVLAQMRPFAGKPRGVFHCFTGAAGDLDQILDLGSLVSFTGIITFRNAQSVRDSAAAVPMGKFMIETDCPFLAPAPHRGKRCEPAYVKEIAGMIAGVKRCTLDEISAATCATAHEFFRLA